MEVKKGVKNRIFRKFTAKRNKIGTSDTNVHGRRAIL